ncbi:MAG: DUF2935 domain-containing protein, partial [Candidatus Limivivens sp.]|nr:DUF2935 domain-containing protein [Candidatus Limivivens sp.]
KNEDLIRRADWFRKQFEEFLGDVVEFASGRVRQEVLDSGEIVTVYTEKAEQKTGFLTGIPIDSEITAAESKLQPGRLGWNSGLTGRQVRWLNNRALSLTGGLIRFKEEILREVDSCRVFTANYPLLIRHILREAKLYQSTIQELNRRGNLVSQSLQSMEQFWNRIMMEHAFFIRGLLDPSEEELIRTANGFAGDYKKLLEEAKEKDSQTLDEQTRKILEETIRYRDFKAAGTRGISECEISSVILPLLADHVLRESNHYLRILE